MKRRKFLRNLGGAGVGFMVIPPSLQPYFKEQKMGIVVHSYGMRWLSKTPSEKYPPFNNAMELMDHCYKIGAGGVQVMVKDWTEAFAKKVQAKREQLGLFVEGSISVPANESDLPRFESEIVRAKIAGVNIFRTVTSSGRRYEVYQNKNEVEDFKQRALSSLRIAEPILKKHKVKLAVENHKDWRADELVAALKQLQSEWIGVTLDFGNSISLLENPMEVVEKLSPFVLSTHVKDMGVDEYEDGFLLSEVPLGSGILALDKMFELCRKHNPAVAFSLEMITRDPLQIPCLKESYKNALEGVPQQDFTKTLKMVGKHKNKYLPRISSLSPEEKLAAEEKNVTDCIAYSKHKLLLNTI